MPLIGEQFCWRIPGISYLPQRFGQASQTWTEVAKNSAAMGRKYDRGSLFLEENGS